MFGVKKVIVYLNSMSNQIQGLNAGLELIAGGIKGLSEAIEELGKRIDALEARIDALEARIDALEARMDSLEARMDAVEARLDAVETRLDAMDEKIDMVEYHLSKEIQVTYQTALENKKGIEILSDHFEEGRRYMVAESHKIAELSVRFDELQKRCVGA